MTMEDTNIITNWESDTKEQKLAGILVAVKLHKLKEAQRIEREQRLQEEEWRRRRKHSPRTQPMNDPFKERSGCMSVLVCIVLILQLLFLF